MREREGERKHNHIHALTVFLVSSLGPIIDNRSLTRTISAQQYLRLANVHKWNEINFEITSYQNFDEVFHMNKKILLLIICSKQCT